MSVGSRPTEKMSLRMVAAMSERTPDGRGTVMTMASETSMAAHTRPETRESSSVVCKHINYTLKTASTRTRTYYHAKQLQ